MNENKIDLLKCIDNFKFDKDKVKKYGGYEKIATDLSKENMRLAFENHILQSKIDKATKKADELRKYIYRELVDFNVCGSTEAHCLAKDLLDILKEVE